MALSGCAPSKGQQTVDAYNGGLAYYEKGEFDKAMASFTEAIRIDPKFAEAYNKRGVACQKTFVFYKAQADIAKAKELGPEPE